MSNRFIVAEVSKNWPDPRYPTDPPPEACLCGLFESVVNDNYEHGYQLHSFQLHQLKTGPGEMVETIVAVFERFRW